MNDQRITDRSARSPSRVRRVAGRVATGLRVVLIVAILVAGCYMVSGWWRLLSEWRLLSRPQTSQRSDVADLNSMAAVLPLAGQWSFADLDWNVKSNIVEAKEIAARFELLAGSAVAERADELPDISQGLVELAENLRIKPVMRDGNQVYRLDRSDLKAQFVARTVDGRPKAVALAAAYPQSATHWQLLEFAPCQPSGTADIGGAHLLPVPAGARRTGGRFADDGRLLLELISLDSNGDELVSAWRASGWEVRPSGLGDADSFSYLCGRGAEVIYAWSANPRGSLQNLMLVRTPTSSDTKH